MFLLTSSSLKAQTDTLKISWNLNDTTEHVVHYELHRMIGNSLNDTIPGNYSFFQQVDSTNGSISGNRIMYIDRTRDQINPGLLISYRVLAVNDSGLFSTLSDEAHAGIPLISWPVLPDSVKLNPYVTSTIPYDTIFPGNVNFLWDSDHNDSQLSIDTVACINATVIPDNNQNVLRIAADTSNLVDAATVILEVTDPDGFNDRDTLEFYFSLQNPPEIINFDTDPPSPFAKVDSLYEYQVQAVDPDPGDVLTYSLSGAPTFLNINLGSGFMSGTPAITDTGSYNITITVTDLTGLSDSRSYLLAVTDTLLFVNAPEIISSPVDTAYVNVLYQYLVIATDDDPDDTLTFILTQAPAFLSITPQSDTSALISGTPSAVDIGQHNISIRVTDLGGLSDTQNYTLIVIDTSSSNTPPQITSNPDTLAYADSLYEYQVEVFDPDPGEVLQFSLPISPSFIDINENTGLISGTPQISDTGSYSIRVVVTDLFGESDIQNYSLRIRRADTEPPLETVGDPFVYPNPYKESLHKGFPLVIEPIPENAREILIVDPAGKLVYQRQVNPRVSRRFEWYVQDQGIASGLYIYIFKSSGDTKVYSGKIAIIR